MSRLIKWKTKNKNEKDNSWFPFTLWFQILLIFLIAVSLVAFIVLLVS